MKKRLVFLLCAVLLLLTACDKGDSPQQVKASDITNKKVAPHYVVNLYEGTQSFPNTVAFAAANDTAFFPGTTNESGVTLYSMEKSAEPRELRSYKPGEFIGSIAASESNLYVLIIPSDETEKCRVDILDMQGGTVGAVPDVETFIQPDFPRQVFYSDGVLFIHSSSKVTAYNVEKEKAVYSIPVNSDALVTVSGDGQLCIGQAENGAFALRRFSPESDTAAATANFDANYMRMNGGTLWDVYLSDNENLYGYKFSENRLEKLFSWNALGLLGGAVAELSDGSLYCAGKLGFNATNPPLLLSLRTDAEAAEGEPIIFATMDEYGLSLPVQEAVMNWNKTHSATPIEVRNYSVYIKGQDTRGAELRLISDIISGNAPDIYDFSSGAINYIPSSAAFARKGLLEDLYPYLDADPELSRSDFLSGLLDALEIKGGLYELVPEFGVITTIADEKAVGTEESLTYAQLYEALQNSSYFDTVFDKQSDRNYWLGTMVNASGKKLVDWDKGECYFTSDYFRTILELAKARQENGSAEYGGMEDVIKNNKGLLYMCTVQDMWMANIPNSTYGETGRFMGLPELGYVAYPLKTYAISSTSNCKQECWEFLSQFLREGNADKFHLSPRRESLERGIERAWQGAIRDNITEYHPNAVEHMNELLGIIDSTAALSRHDPQIWSIVYTDSQAYFDGQRGIEETMQSIQSKIEIYLAEQS